VACDEAAARAEAERRVAVKHVARACRGIVHTPSEGRCSLSAVIVADRGLKPPVCMTVAERLDSLSRRLRALPDPQGGARG
jgi:hypothetical protein